MELKELVEEFVALKNQKADLEEDVKAINANIETLESEIVLALLNAGTNKQSFPGLGTVSTSNRNFPRIINQDVFYDYLASTGQDGLIKKTVNSKTLASWFSEKELTKEEYEAIGLTNFSKTKINLRRN